MDRARVRPRGGLGGRRGDDRGDHADAGRRLSRSCARRRSRRRAVGVTQSVRGQRDQGFFRSGGEVQRARRARRRSHHGGRELEGPDVGAGRSRRRPLHRRLPRPRAPAAAVVRPAGGRADRDRPRQRGDDRDGERAVRVARVFAHRRWATLPTAATSIWRAARPIRRSSRRRSSPQGAAWASRSTATAIARSSSTIAAGLWMAMPCC